MRHKRIGVILAGLAAPVLLAGGALVGCAEPMRRDRPPADVQPSLAVTASNSEIMTGEVTTFTVTSRNTVGRDARVEWTSTGGDLVTEEGGRIARARFQQPGAYTVTAVLYVDGVEVDRDSRTISVRPVR